MVQIYGLVDPRDKLIHYIGSSVDMDRRLAQHVNDESSTKKCEWLAELAALGLQPYQIQLDTVDDVDRFAVEYRWIYFGRISGWPLKNTTAMITGRYVDLVNSFNKIIATDSADDRSAVYRERQELLDILRSNRYLPVMVDGDIVQLVRPLESDDQGSAMLSIVRLTESGRRYINCRGWTVPISELSTAAVAMLDNYRFPDGGDRND